LSDQLVPSIRARRRWPLPVRGLFIALIFAVVAAFAWYMFVWNDDRPLLKKRRRRAGFAVAVRKTSSSAPPTSKPTGRTF